MRDPVDRPGQSKIHKNLSTKYKQKVFNCATKLYQYKVLKAGTQPYLYLQVLSRV